MRSRLASSPAGGRRRTVDPRTLVATALGALALPAMLALAGCASPTATPTPTLVPSEPSAAPQEPGEASIDLGGTAESNLAYFDKVNEALIAAGGRLDGRAFIDNLIEVGYPRNDLEVTPDSTAIGGAADNISFAIRLNGTCLIGQYGNIGYASTTAKLLGTGRCLIGETLPIDW